MAGAMDPFQYNTIEIPTVVGLLKNILTQYPDNGQIIKELVQNAEDAEATKVEVIHDTRNLDFPNAHEAVRRFVQGPALCVYNNAVFSEEDWHGIRKLSDSIKKNDPLRVGQFGLGFKSVFHMTDYVTIISGSSVLFMDPNEPEQRMCRSLKLCALKNVFPSPAITQLWGSYIDQSHLTNGNFPGTLFWFPLRQKPTELSLTIYTWNHVRMLFDSFIMEANICLTFLKALEHVSLLRVTGDSTNPTVIHQVELTGSTSLDLLQARELRSKLRKELRECGGRPEYTICSQYQITLRSTQGTQITDQTLLVLHLLPGKRDLFYIKHINNENIRLIPLVGVAAPLDPLNTQRGHLFAFLPLPPDPSNTTGLPVQINANFTLDQNRRHVKWKTHHTAMEPDVLWNEELVSRVVLEAYHKLLIEVHSQAVRKNNATKWYSLLPNLNTTDGRWNELARQLWSKFLSLAIIHSQMQGFMPTSEVISDDTLNNCSDTLSICVRDVLLYCKKPLATLPPHVSNSLQILNFSPQAVTPKLVRDTLRSVKGLKTDWNHFLLLDYITSDSCYQDLNGIPLLPLNNGSWDSYNLYSPPVYICSVDQAKAFWGLDENILLTNLPPVLLIRLKNIALNNTTQLVEFNEQKHCVDLLGKSVVKVQEHKLQHQQHETWLIQVWELLQQLQLSSVANLALLPSCHQLSSQSDLLPLSTPIMVINSQAPLINAAVKALTNLGVTVVPKPQNYIRHYQLHSYLHNSDSTGVNEVLQKVLVRKNLQKLASYFNTNCSDAQCNALVNIIDPFSVHLLVKNLLQKLNIFKAIQGYGLVTNACIENVKDIAPDDDNFPVKYPHFLLKPQTIKHKQLAQQLGAKQLSKEQLCLEALHHNYSDEDTVKLAMYILDDRSLIVNRNIINKLKQLRFVSDVNGVFHLPVELYNPLDPDIDAFIGEDLIPSKKYRNYVSVLQQLGLQQVVDLPRHVLVQAISHVQAPTLSQQEKTQKSSALLRILEKRVDCSEVCKEVRDVPFVFGKTSRPNHYPDTLSWATQPGLLSPRNLKDYNKYHDTLGSVIQLIDCSQFPNVGKGFGWKSDPKMNSFITHFHNFLKAKIHSKTILKMAKNIYQHLTSFLNTSEAYQLKSLSKVFCVLTEDGFKLPCQVYLRTFRNDLQLLPHMHCLPYELQEYNSLFQFWGCYDNQNVELYLKLLKQIQEYHNKNTQVDVEHDLNLVVSVLDKLSRSVNNINTLQLLLPVENENDKLELIDIEYCSYSDQSCDWLNSDEMGMRVVHKQVGTNLAQRLGVKQLNQHLISGGEAIMEWGQREPLTTRLRNLLHQYRDGVSVLKELIQNADDAGATEIQFLYDERENLNARKKLLNQQLEQWQGPALWAYNNASFTENDFYNLRELGGGTKEFQSTKIGKFGLGFNSVYNLTDVPSFVSGCSFVIFDPHLSHLGPDNKSPGIRYKFDNEKNCYLLKKAEGQFKPFEHVFGCSLQKSNKFDGTLFRFPLRTQALAGASKISNSSYEHEDMIQLLEMFQKLIGEILLFTQNVQQIKVFHLSKLATSPKDKQLLFESSRTLKDVVNSRETPMNEANALFIKNPLTGTFKWNGKLYEDTVFCDIKVKIHSAGKDICGGNVGTYSVTWVTSWHSGNGRLCRLAEGLSGKALPLAAVSVPVVYCSDGWKPLNLAELPCGFYNISYLHCFLPLPVKTTLPVQINGFFEVASDRTALLSKTVDDRQEMNWNATVIDDAVNAAYINVISTLISEGLTSDIQYYKLWPLISNTDDQLTVLPRSFYNSIITDNLKVFRSNCGWHPLSQCLFFENSFQKCKDITNVAFEYMEKYLSKSGKQYMIDLPSKVQEGFQSEVISQYCISQDGFYKKYFIPSLNNELVTPEKRDRLTLNLLDTGSACRDNLKGIMCIPTKPNGKLRAPGDLIKPESKVAMMFSLSDERFPKDMFINTIYRCEILDNLGMNTNVIPAKWVSERAGTVNQLQCPQCAVKRSKEIIKYIGNVNEKDENIIAVTLKYVPFLPIMKKPNDWKYIWKGDSHQTKYPVQVQVLCADHCNNTDTGTCVQKFTSFTIPSDLHLSTFKILVGSNHLILSPNLEVKNKSQLLIFEKLGLVTDPFHLPIQSVFKQLLIFSTTTNIDDKLNSWCHFIYEHIEQLLIKGNDQIVDEVSSLRNEKILLTKCGFVYPEVFALGSDVDCTPDLFSASSEGLLKYKNLMQSLGIEARFSYKAVMEVLLRKKENCGDKKLDNCKIEKISNLLNELFKSRNDDCESNVLPVSSLYLPDAEGCLQSINNLCVDDEVQLSSGHFFCIHRGIKVSQDMLEWLGIKSKTRKRLEDSCNRLQFGQSELLTTRLRNILEDYPCDSAIMKELLQNADDSGATKITFIQDLRHLPKGKLFDKQWAPLQGPALTVYNNKGFTARDLESIQDLGNSSKKEDPASTGQFGIGFNAVYHLTDAPSFLTKGPEVPHGETICMFDPHCRYNPLATRDKPGVQLINLSDLRKDHPHSFLGYLENDLLQNEGTVFRLPLRTSDNSEISKKIITTNKLLQMLDEFMKEMKKCMLFLRNVREISILEISKSGEKTTKYWVKSDVSEKPNMLNTALLGKKGNTISRKHLYNIDMEREEYKMKISGSDGHTSNWYVAQQLGAETKDTVPEIVKDAFNYGSLSLLPHASVALLMNSNSHFDKDIQTVSCYLPLPVESGLPFSINGHFALASTRHDLWNGDGDIKAEWNNWLTKEILVPVTVRAIDFCRSNIFPVDDNTPWRMTEREYHSKMNSYNKRLPNMKNIESKHWKKFTKWFYEYVREQQLLFYDVFIPESDKYEPVHTGTFINFQSSTKESKKCERNGVVEWHAFREDGHEFPVYFVNSKISPNIVDTLLRFGMKVCIGVVSDRIYSADPEYSYPLLTPATALDFLLSWNKDFTDKCKDFLGKNVKQTPFLVAGNVDKVLAYISHGEQFKTGIINLPLLLTSDSIMRHFNAEEPVFVSHYCNLFQTIGEKFIHESLISNIEKYYKLFEEANVVKQFTIEDLNDFLPSVLDSSYDSEDAEVKLKKSSDIPNIEWIKKLWEFIVSVIKTKFGEKNETGGIMVNWKEGRQYILQSLGNWALYPVSMNKNVYLIPVSKTWKALSHTTFLQDSVFRSLPVFYPYILYNYYYMDARSVSVIPGDLKLAATAEAPDAVLKVLYEFREHISSYIVREGKPEYASEILKYFGQHCRKCSLSKDQLSSLGIYEDAGSQFCRINGLKIIVSSKKLCPMKQIALDNRYIILKCAHSDILELYNYIDEGILLEDLDIFAKFILPNIQCLIEDERIMYMEELRDLLRYKNESSESQVVLVLKRTKFLEVNGSLVSADKLYDPSNEVFKVMELANVPEKWAGYEWREFLKLAGMVHTVTPEKFVEFARMLKASDNEVKKKSKVLVSHLREHYDKMNTVLTELKSIEFLVPHHIETSTVTRILPHFDTNSGLISYSTGYHSKFQYVLWSAAGLLPRYATSNTELMKEFGVSDTAPEDKVVQHITRLCQAISKAKGIIENDVLYLMEKVYEYLLTSNTIFDIFSQSEIPLIHIPSHNTFVPASFVVQNLEEEIIPYLYQGPSMYGKYFNVFRKLGMEQKSVNTYAIVLKRIYEASHQQKLNPEEYNCMVMAMEGMLRHELHIKNMDVDVLYLPTRDRKLYDSSKMFVADNQELMNATEGKLKSPLFAGFIALKIDKNNSDFVRRLPTRLRPKFLSEVVQEQLEAGGEEVSSQVFDQLQEFLSCDFLTSAILRVINDMKVRDALGITEDEKREIVEKINQISVKQLKEVNVIQKLHGDNIGTRSKFYQIQASDHAFTLYLSETIPPNLIPTALTQIFNMILDLKDSDLTTYLGAICNCFKKPHDIHKYLDEIGIKDYGNSSSSFTLDLGSYLEENFLHLLDNTFGQFHEREIVCMKKYLSENEGETEDDDIFIIVKVIRMKSKSTVCKMFDVYEIIIDEEGTCASVKAHQLYRFVRESAGPLVIFNQLHDNQSQPQEEIPMSEEEEVSEEELRRKIRQEVLQIWEVNDERERHHLLRRLLFQWHPDKNLHRVELCTRLVQYIQSLVGRLERGETIPNDDDDDDDSTAPGPSQFYSYTFRPPPSQYTSSHGAFGGARHRNGNRRNTSNQGTWDGRRRSDYREAKMWWRHAEHDLEVARRVDGPACWIIYIAHQAAEKFLKACLYAVNRDASRDWKGVPLSDLCSRLSHAAAMALIREIEGRIGAFGRMRYPNLNGCPCDEYEADDAMFVLEKVRKLKEELTPTIQSRGGG